MTKNELLTQLAGFDWVNHLVGEPIQDTVQADGTIVYIQNLLDVAIDTGVYRDVQFYVYQEGEVDELAVYKDSIPVSIVANANKILQTEVEDELIRMIGASQIPDRVFSVTVADARTKTGIVQALLDDSSTTPDDAIVSGFAYKQNPDKSLVLTKINEPADIILQLGNRNNVQN